MNSQVSILLGVAKWNPPKAMSVYTHATLKINDPVRRAPSKMATVSKSDAHAKILSALSSGPMTASQIAVIIKMPPVNIPKRMLEIEAGGLIKKLPDKKLGIGNKPSFIWALV